MSVRRLARLLACTGVIAAVACIDITVSDSAIGSLQFVPLPFPSVDADDTLRNASDIAEPLTAIVYRANGSIDSSVRVTFVTLDSGLKVDSTRRVVVSNPLPATSTVRSVRIIASVPGLQSTARTLFVVPRADVFLTDSTKLKDSILYTLPSASTDVSGELKVTIGKKGGTVATPTIAPSQGYLVRYTLKRGNTTLPANDTLGAFTLQSPDGRISSVDTTDASGQASRQLRFRFRSGQPTVDTVTVLAEAKRGSRLTNTIQWTVVVRPKTAS